MVRACELRARVLKALAHPTRIALLEMMQNGPICACEVVDRSGLPQPSVARHLAALRESQVIASRRDGVRVLYEVVDPRVFQLLEMVSSVVHDRFRESMQALEVDSQGRME